MKYITKEQLDHLCATNSDTASLISIYIPMHKFDFEINQTRFKNVMKSLKTRLPDLETYRHFDELQKLQDDPVFWANQKDGVCFFLSPDEFLQVGLPFIPPAFHEVADRYFTAPLILYRFAEAPYYVVALSLKKVRVFDATMFDIQERDIPGLDQDLFERLRIDEINETLQVHTSGREGLAGSSQQVKHHGHGGSSEKLRLTLLTKCIRSVCQEIKPYLGDQHRRVIFAGAASHFPIFRDEAGFVNSIVPQFLEGSFDTSGLKDLHGRLVPVIRDLLMQEVRLIDAAADDQRGTSLFEIRNPQIIQAARYGQVDSLIVNVERFLRNFKAPSTDVRSYEAAIRETFLHGGKVVPTFDNHSLAMKAMKRFSTDGASLHA